MFEWQRIIRLDSGLIKSLAKGLAESVMLVLKLVEEIACVFRSTRLTSTALASCVSSQSENVVRPLK